MEDEGKHQFNKKYSNRLIDIIIYTYIYIQTSETLLKIGEK